MAAPSLPRLLLGPRPDDDLTQHQDHLRTFGLGMAFGGALGGVLWLGHLLQDAIDPPTYWFVPLLVGFAFAFVLPPLVRAGAERRRARQPAPRS